MTIHKCDAIVIVCIDFRFQKYIQKWLNRQMKNKTYDLVGYAGSSKDLDTVIKQIDISVRLHHVKQVVLMHHEDCGAYAEEGNHTRHVKDLGKAKKRILAKYPKIIVDLYYIHLDGNFEKIVSLR